VAGWRGAREGLAERQGDREGGQGEEEHLHGAAEDDGVEEPGHRQPHRHVEQVGADGGGDRHVPLQGGHVGPRCR